MTDLIPMQRFTVTGEIVERPTRKIQFEVHCSRGSCAGNFTNGIGPTMDFFETALASEQFQERRK
jgi:hypothetical protein